jgi:sortase A
VKHLSEGTVRRMLDEPGKSDPDDRSHLDSCERCQEVEREVRADADALTALFGPELVPPDPDAGLIRVNEAIAARTRAAEPKPRRRSKAEPLTGGSRALMMVGRTFVGIGTFILLFVGYQLLGTNLVTNKEQKALAAELETQWTSNVVEETPDLGAGVALIKIPKIGVDRVVVEGIGVADLKKGPGHFPDTAMPGQLGNMVVSGHRTTYGAPFNRLDELEVGDELVVYDRTGPFRYLVSEKKIVKPTAVEVLDPSSDARLTLTTCHPKFSARERLIIVAQLEGTPRGAANTVPGPGVEVLPET